jgi:hypothetical protein
MVTRIIGAFLAVWFAGLAVVLTTGNPPPVTLSA